MILKSWVDDGNLHDKNRSRVLFDEYEFVQRNGKPGVEVVTDEYSAHDSHDLWSEWYCRHLAEKFERDMTETTEAIQSDDRRKETTSSAHDHFSWTVLFSGSSSGHRTLGVPSVALQEEAEKQVRQWNQAYYLEALKTEELEKHLIFNSNRLRTFDDTRLEIVTYVETKFCLRIRDSKSSHTGQCAHSDPMDVDAVNSLSSDKGSSSPRDECFKYARAYFQRDCNVVIVQTSNRLTRTDRASHDPRVKIKRSKREQENIQEKVERNPRYERHVQG